VCVCVFALADLASARSSSCPSLQPNSHTLLTPSRRMDSHARVYSGPAGCSACVRGSLGSFGAGAASRPPVWSFALDRIPPARGGKPWPSPEGLRFQRPVLLSATSTPKASPPVKCVHFSIFFWCAVLPTTTELRPRLPPRRRSGVAGGGVRVAGTAPCASPTASSTYE
jgi:hypothetical protein